MSNPTTSLQPVDFTVLVDSEYEHYYAITGVAVTATLGAGYPVHHRFTIRCLGDSLITTSGLDIQLPEGKILAPFGDNAVIGFTVIATDLVLVFGDLADA